MGSERKILIISKDFWPCNNAGVQRILKFAQYLPEFGWSPDILTAHQRTYANIDITRSLPTHLEGRVHRAQGLDAKKHLAVAGRYPKYFDYPDRFSTWLWDGVRMGSRIIEETQPDILLSTFPVVTAHRIGLELSRKYDIPWIVDFRDPMTYGSPNSVQRQTPMKDLEREIVHAASAYTFATRQIAKTYEQYYPHILSRQRFVIENGYDEELFSSVSAEPDRLSEANAGVNFLHSGYLYGEERNPTHFLRALRGLSDDETPRTRPLRAVFQGDRDQSYSDFVDEIGLGDLVEFRPTVALHKSIQSLKQADVLLLIQGRKYRNQIPSKVYEYLAAKKPILALTDKDSATGELLSDVPWSIIAPHDDVDAIKDAILKIQDLKPNESFDPRIYGRRLRTQSLADALNIVAQSHPVSHVPKRGVVRRPPALALKDGSVSIHYKHSPSGSTFQQEADFLSMTSINPPHLMIVMDVEEEFDWRRPHPGVAWDFNALDGMKTFQSAMTNLGMPVCLLVDYLVATIPQAAETFRGWVETGEVEIGSQLHCWITPPHVETDPALTSFQCNLESELERKKIETITETIESLIGSRPEVFRAGRYGFGPATAQILKEMGYKVDISIMPNSSYRFEGGGPDATRVPDFPFWLDVERTLLEIPVTRGVIGGWKNGFYRRPWRVFDSPLSRSLMLPAVLARLGILERITLSPEGQSYEDMVRLVEEQLNWSKSVFCISFHSSSLTPGGSPFVQSDKDVAELIDRTARLVEYLTQTHGFVPSTPMTYYGAVQQLAEADGSPAALLQTGTQ